MAFDGITIANITKELQDTFNRRKDFQDRTAGKRRTAVNDQIFCRTIPSLYQRKCFSSADLPDRCQ